jgi:hypothetical protein
MPGLAPGDNCIAKEGKIKTFKCNCGVYEKLKKWVDREAGRYYYDSL